MTISPSDNHKNIRLLFFGRNECKASDLILKRLKKYDFDITYFKSKIRNEQIPRKILQWEGEYILSFRNLFVIPNFLLKKAKFFPINFHPAPPEYPGSGCVNFALYDGVKEYGVTAHVMNEKIDNGTIIEVRRFPVNSFDNLKTLLTRTHTELMKLCLDFIEIIHTNGTQLINKKIITSKKEKWSGKAKRIKQITDLQTISPDISKKELKKIIRATYIQDFPPKIRIHGFNFYLRLDE